MYQMVYGVGKYLWLFRNGSPAYNDDRNSFLHFPNRFGEEFDIFSFYEILTVFFSN